MKKWILLVVLLIANLGVSAFALAPNFVTFAQIYPKNIEYKVGDNGSIKSAIIQARSEGIELGRKYFGSGSFLLSGMVLINFIILVIVVAKNNGRGNKNDS